MRTPAGTECSFYYEDFYRGNELQECRIPKDPRSKAWDPGTCAHCEVPAILLANGSPWLDLTIRISRWPIVGTRVAVTARCTKHGIPIADPYVGCPRDFEDMPEL